MSEENYEEEGVMVVTNSGMEIFEAQERAAFDIQISTAKRFPRRSVQVILKSCVELATLDVDSASSCRYAKPVGDNKIVSGISVHLARILSQQYGNLRVQQRIKQITDTSIIAEAVAFDLETNFAISVEARKSILDKYGKRFKQSTIDTNAMAILAIAERNAILKIIPKSIIDSVDKAALKKVEDSLKTDKKMSSALTETLRLFKERYNAEVSDICKLLKILDISEVTKEHMLQLKGFWQALKDNDITADEMFGRVRPTGADEKTPAPNAFAKKEEKTANTPPSEEKKPESADAAPSKQINPDQKLFK